MSSIIKTAEGKQNRSGCACLFYCKIKVINNSSSLQMSCCHVELSVYIDVFGISVSGSIDINFVF